MRNISACVFGMWTLTSNFQTAPGIVSTSTMVFHIGGAGTCPSRVTHTPLTYRTCLHAAYTTPSLSGPRSTHAKGYHTGILIYMWNVLPYASSSVESAIWLLPCDSESLALLIEWVWGWNTHTAESIHPSTYTPTGDFVANAGRERDECQALRDGWTSITACQPHLFFFFPLHSTPPPHPLTFFLPHWSGFVFFGGVCVYVENAVWPHGQDAGSLQVLSFSAAN